MIEETLLRIAVALEKLVLLKAANTALATMEPEEKEEVRAGVAEKLEETPAGEQPPKKRRGRPTKEEAAAKAAAMAEQVVAEVSEGAGQAIAAALPVEQPKCADCGAELTPENSSKSSQTHKLHHIGCKGTPAEQAEPLKIEKVRDAALSFTKKKSDAGEDGRAAFIAVLATFKKPDGSPAASLREIPEAQWPELLKKLVA